MLRLRTSKILAQFCRQKLSKSALEAIWAEAIFTEILQAGRRDFDFDDSTLVDHLLNFKLPAKSLQNLEGFKNKMGEVEEVRKQMVKMFDPYEGVKINDQILNLQTRFSKGKQLGKKFSFYPNTFTTSTVFLVLKEYFQESSKCMIIGKEGISKSVGLLLGWYLSSKTINFRFNNTSMAKQLVKKQLLLQKFSKIIYLSFASDKVSYSHFVNVILAQCPEISHKYSHFREQGQSKNITRQNLQQILLTLKNVYEGKNMKCLFIMDQVNTLARNFGGYNQAKKKIVLGQALDDSDESFYAHGPIFFRIYNQIVRNFPTLFNSSSNIEQELLDDRQLADHIYFTLNLNHHSKVQMKKCNYNIANNQKHRRELCRFIWYESTRFINQSDRSAVQGMFKEVCDELAATNKELGSFMTPLSIRDGLAECKHLFANLLEQKKELQQKIYNFIFNELKLWNPLQGQKEIQSKLKQFVLKEFDLSINEEKKLKKAEKIKQIIIGSQKLKRPSQMSYLSASVKAFVDEELKTSGLPKLKNIIQQKVKDLVDNLYKQIKIVGLNLVREKVKKYLKQQKNPNIEKQKYLITLYCASYFYQFKNQPQWPKIPIANLQNLMKMQNIKKYYNKDLYQLKYNQYLQAKVSHIELEQISIDWLVAQMGYPGDQSILKSAHLTGWMIQMFLIDLLKRNNKFMLCTDNQKYTFREVLQFEHFLSSKQKLEMRKNLEKVLEAAKSLMQEDYCLGLPTPASKLKANQSNTSPNDPNLDLLAVAYKNTGIQIVTFDVTVVKDSSKIKTKLAKAQSLIEELLNNNTNTTASDPNKLLISSWKHIILCKNAHLKEFQPMSHKWYQTEISYELKDLAKLQVFTSQVQDETTMKLLARLNNLLRNLNKISAD